MGTSADEYLYSMRLVSFLLVLCLVSCKNEPKLDIAVVTDEASSHIPELEVYDYKGLQKYLNTTSDSTFVINFWATWCAPCVKELPSFERINSEYADKKVKVILVSLDFPKKYESNLKPFIKEKQLKSKVVALNDPDSNAWIPKINEDWSGAIPATLIYTKDKRQFFEKSFTYNELETELKQFLK